jgi:hypothetical protein
MAYFTGGDVKAALANSDDAAGAMINDLLRWSTALKTARSQAA